MPAEVGSHFVALLKMHPNLVQREDIKVNSFAKITNALHCLYSKKTAKSDPYTQQPKTIVLKP